MNIEQAKVFVKELIGACMVKLINYEVTETIHFNKKTIKKKHIIGYLGRYYEGFWKKGVLIVHVKKIQDMFDKVKMSRKSVCGKTKNFTVKVGVHRGSTLDPYLFSLVMGELTKKVHDEILWCMMFTDYVVLVDNNTNV